MSKSKSPEAAQRKVWAQEIRQLEASAKKLNSDFYAEQRTLQKAIRAAERQLSLANRKYAAFVTRRAKVVPKTLREIETRIAVLRGRIEA